MRKKRQLLFVQGGGEGTHDEWDDKLVASLDRELGQGYDLHYPRMPREDDPSFPRWKPALERELEQLAAGAVLVGHSIGGTILLKLLSETPPPPELLGIFLVAAPFVGEAGWSVDALQLPRDLGARLPQSTPLHFYHGLADEIAPPEHLELFARAVPQAHVHRLPDRDHQLNDDLREVAQTILSLAG
jgi:predicted alpha/beta hydrolase family esterase